MLCERKAAFEEERDERHRILREEPDYPFGDRLTRLPSALNRKSDIECHPTDAGILPPTEVGARPLRTRGRVFRRGLDPHVILTTAPYFAGNV